MNKRYVYGSPFYGNMQEVHNEADNRKRYVYLVTGMVMLLFLGLIYAWSIFRAPLGAEYGWSVSQMSLTFTISIIAFCLGIYSAGRLLRKARPSSMFILSAALVFIGFMGASRMSPDNDSSLIMLYIFYGAFVGTGVGFGYNTIISTVNRWFRDRLGFASGSMMMAFGLGGIVLGTMVKEMISSIGLHDTFIVLAIITTAAMLAGAVLLKAPVITDAKIVRAESAGYSPKEMMKTPFFWYFFIWGAVVTSAGLMVINSAVPIALAFGGFALLGLLESIFNGTGRVVFGSLFDKIKERSLTIHAVSLIIGGAALVTAAYTGNLVVVIIGMLVVGLVYGGTPAFTSTIAHDYFGKKYHPENFSIMSFILIPGALIGPMVSGYLVDQSGDYTSTFIVVFVLAIVAALLNTAFRIAGKKMKPVDEGQ